MKNAGIKARFIISGPGISRSDNHSGVRGLYLDAISQFRERGCESKSMGVVYCVACESFPDEPVSKLDVLVLCIIESYVHLNPDSGLLVEDWEFSFLWNQW